MNTAEALRLVAALTTDEQTPEVSRGAIPDQVLIRTVTHYHVGRVVSIDDRWIVLDDASWVADTGRFSAALSTGTLGEVEPFAGPVWISVGAVVDMTGWPHPLTKVVK